MQKILKFIYSLLIVAVTAAASSYFTEYGIKGWYHQAAGNMFTPPDSVFPIVWTTLYLFLAISFYLILQSPDKAEKTDAKHLFFSQLILQVIWCFAFFHQGQLGLGLLIILFMVWLAWKMLKLFARIEHKTVYLLVPYLAWISYASLLNLLYVINNGLVVKF